MRISVVIWEALARHVVKLICVVSLISFVWVYLERPETVPVRADAIGYYSYLPALFIYQDLTMEKLGPGSFGMDQLPSWTGIQRFPETGRYLNKYTMGVAVLMSPFFILAHLLSVVFGFAPTGFTFIYQVMGGLAGLFYAAIGFYFLRKVLLLYFSDGISAMTLLCLFFGTNLWNYMVYESAFSHSYSFFLLSAFLWMIHQWHEFPTIKHSLVLGLLCGLIILVRIPNVLVLLLLPLFKVERMADLRGRLDFIKSHIREICFALVTVIVVLLPQLWYWNSMTGRWILNSYQQEGFQFLQPHFLEVLLSARRGLFVWSPVLIFSLVGLWVMWRNGSPWTTGISLFLIFNLYVIASWHMWWYGSGFGHRAFVESFAVMAIPLAFFLNKVWLQRRGVPVVMLAAILMAGYTVLKTVQYWKGAIPPYGFTKWQDYRRTFFEFANADTWFVRGKYLYEQGKFSEAIEALNLANDLEVSHANARYLRGLCFAHTGNFEKALDDMTVATLLKADFAIAHLSRAGVLENTSRMQEALESYTNALIYSSNAPEPAALIDAAKSGIARIERRLREAEPGHRPQ